MISLTILALTLAVPGSAAVSVNMAPERTVSCYDGDEHRLVNSMDRRVATEDAETITLAFVAVVSDCFWNGSKLEQRIRAPFFQKGKNAIGIVPYEGLLFEAERVGYEAGTAWSFKLYFPKKALDDAGGRQDFRLSYHFNRDLAYPWRIRLERLDGDRYSVSLLTSN